MPSNLIISSCLAFCGFAGLSYAISYLLVGEDSRVRNRVKETANRYNPQAENDSRLRNWFHRKLSTLCLLFFNENAEKANSSESRLEARLRYAGYYGKQSQLIYFTITILMTAFPTLIAIGLIFFRLIPTELAVWISLIGGGVGMLVPGLWLDKKKSQRILSLIRSLPDFLDLMITCLSSGLSLEAALKRVSTEIGSAHPLLSSELNRVQHEINLGSTVDTALMSFAERSDCEEVRSLASLCQQSRQYGTRINDAFRAHADLLRTKREMRAEEMAQTAVVKILMPTMLLIFPSVFVVLAGPAAIQIFEHFGNP